MKKLIILSLAFYIIIISNLLSDETICMDENWNNWNNCLGTLSNINGGKYIGDWKDGKKHGQGSYIWYEGNTYIGEWKDGKLHGQGIYVHTNGFQYEGEWKDDNCPKCKKTKVKKNYIAETKLKVERKIEKHESIFKVQIEGIRDLKKDREAKLKKEREAKLKKEPKDNVTRMREANLKKLNEIKEKAKEKNPPGEVDGKGIDCKLVSSSKNKIPATPMYWFNNNMVSLISLDYYNHKDLSRPGFDAPNGYEAGPNKIIFSLRGYKYSLNRKNLELEAFEFITISEDYTEWDYKKVAQWSCKVFTSYVEVQNKVREMRKKKKQKILEEQERDRKARIGNKI